MTHAPCAVDAEEDGSYLWHTNEKFGKPVSDCSASITDDCDKYQGTSASDQCATTGAKSQDSDTVLSLQSDENNKALHPSKVVASMPKIDPEVMTETDVVIGPNFEPEAELENELKEESDTALSP